jgi:hypothetical protein
MPGDANAGQTDEATKNNSFLNYLRNEIDQFSINSRQQKNELLLASYSITATALVGRRHHINDNKENDFAGTDAGDEGRGRQRRRSTRRRSHDEGGRRGRGLR